MKNLPYGLPLWLMWSGLRKRYLASGSVVLCSSVAGCADLLDIPDHPRLAVEHASTPMENQTVESLDAAVAREADGRDPGDAVDVVESMAVDLPLGNLKPDDSETPASEQPSDAGSSGPAATAPPDAATPTPICVAPGSLGPNGTATCS